MFSENDMQDLLSDVRQYVIDVNENYQMARKAQLLRALMKQWTTDAIEELDAWRERENV